MMEDESGGGVSLVEAVNRGKDGTGFAFSGIMTVDGGRGVKLP
jgi:hypothetical protein